MKAVSCLSLISFVFVSACASHDYQDRYLLGAATERNAELQSVRSMDAPEYRPVVHGAGAGLGDRDGHEGAKGEGEK